MISRPLLRLSLLATILLSMPALAQEVLLPAEEYQQRKLEGTLPEGARPAAVAAATSAQARPASVGSPKGGGGGNNACECWIEPDASYLLAMQPNDDGSSPAITLPFQFNLYSELYNVAYINNNGNISFVTPFSTFSASGFPSAQFRMVAPFWGDVDTRPANGGQVWYKVTPTAMYVNWVEVGYFNMQTDKLNTFQAIITDGTDPVIGIGNNVAFCYKDMQWTTGSASGGVNGFGGTPATVGANRGNGADFIQFGRFDQAGDAYDGPFGASDGVDWLDDKNFRFTTAVSTNNIPPIPTGDLICDTLQICVGETVTIDISFLSPESDQITTAASTAPSLSNYVVTSNTPGITATIVGEFTPTADEEGYHTITFTGTDNGDPPLTATVEIVVFVRPAAPPVEITGDSQICGAGLAFLSATGGFDEYQWSNGSSGQTITAFETSTFTVTAFLDGCPSTSAPFTVTVLPAPEPVITGPTASCAGEPVTLTTTEPYDTYEWSNGASDQAVSVTSGSYTVTVTDQNGCTGTSAAYNVVVENDPTAFFTADPPSPQLPGVVVDFMDGSDGNGSTITGWTWTIGDPPVVIDGPMAGATFNTPGFYDITLTVTTGNGCTGTYTFTYVVAPAEIIVPNVFSPNNDGVNDFLVFENLQFYPNSRLTVYSRWGNVVYENSSYQNNWRAQGVSEGTYFFVLSMQDGRKYEGHVTIVR